MNTRISSFSRFAAIAALALTTSGVALATDSSDTKAPAAQPAKADKLSDAQILGVTNVANTGEIEQSQVAQARTRSDKVKNFADMMIKDHTAAKNKGLTLAKDLGLTPETSSKGAKVQQDGAEALKTLNDAAASDFDKTFLKTEIDLHQKTVKLLDQLISDASSPQIKSFLTDMRATVEHHLSMAHSDLGAVTNSK